MEVETAKRTGGRSELGEPPCLPFDPNRVRATRHLTLYQDARDKVQEVYVAGGVATIIWLPAKLAARGARIEAGGKRRFQLLTGGNQIVVTPTRQLAEGERFTMEVALADGMSIPLSLTRGRWPDGDVWLDREQANPEELRHRLAAVTAKAKGFEVSLRQALKEQESGDYALAGMMATNQSGLTAFEKARQRELVNSAVRRVSLTTYTLRSDAASATSKVVAVFQVKNWRAEPLDLSSGRALLKGGDDVPFALRALPAVIPPDGEGRIAVVLDRESFGEGQTITLSFSDKPQVAGIQLSAELSLEDFNAPTQSSSRWWPF